MSEHTAEPLPRGRTRVFRGSLVRTVVLLFIFIALIPAAIVGAASYIRYQNALQSTLSSQLQLFGISYSLQMDQLSSSNQAFANKIALADTINSNLQSTSYGILSLGDEASNTTVFNYLSDQVANSYSEGISEIDIIGSETGFIYASSNEDRLYTRINDDQWLKKLYKSDGTSLLYDPAGLFGNKLLLVSSKTISGGINTPAVTILVFSSPTGLSTILSNPVSTYSSAHVFYKITSGQIVSLNPVTNRPVVVKLADDQLAKVNGYATSSENGKEFSYTSFTGIDVNSFVEPLKTVDSYYFIEVPQLLIENQLDELRNFIFLLLGITLGLSIIVALISARQVATPLVQLSSKARSFAAGDFSQKAQVNRRDEIGLLAQSFNYMVDQLSTFYQSLESKVADRTKQLQRATEIGQEVISATRVTEILSKAAKSTSENFNVPYVSTYLLDQKKKVLTLSEDFSTNPQGLPPRNLQIPLDNNSLIGWVANNDQVRISQDILNERPKMSEAAHAKFAQSEIGIPIRSGDRLFGVLNIQNDQPQGFELDSMPTYTVLANQIATGLRNIELLETTQFTLQESSFLSEFSREIVHLKNEDEIYEKMNDLFTHTSYAAFSLDVENEEAIIVNIADAKGNPADKSLLGLSFPFADALTKLKEEGIKVIPDFLILNEFSTLTAYLGRRGCQSAAILPIYEGDSLLHFLAIGSREEEPLTLDRIQPYEILTEAIGTTFERLHLLLRSEKWKNEFALINNISSINLENSDILNLCINVHEKLNNIYGKDLGFCLALNDEKHQSLTIPYFKDEELISVENYDYSNDLLSLLINTREKQDIADAFSKGQYVIDSPLVQRSAKSWLGYPLFVGGKVIGAVGFFDPNHENSFDQSFKNITELISSQITLAVSDYLVQKELASSQSHLDEEKFLFGSLLESIPVRIAFKNTKNEFIRVSKSFANFLGFDDTDDLLGKTDDFHYVVEDEADQPTADNELISTQTPVLNKFEMWKKSNGEYESLISTKIPLTTTQGDVLGLLNISENVTDRIKAEQLAKHRADQLLTASEIAKDSTAGSMDVQVTLAKLVEMIRSRFGFYHASIFMIDPLGKNAVLRESTGEAGAQMKSVGHKLAVGSPSIVGQATGRGEPVVIGDVTQEANYFANPLLPETRSELAIPLKIGEKILGALDVQSKTINAFTQDDVNILQALADQIAVAIQNADLYTHTNQNLSRYQLLHEITSANVQSLSVEDAIHRTIEILHQAMPTEKIMYLGLDENNFLIAQFSAGYPTPDLTTRRIPLGQGAIGTVAKEHKPVRIDDVQTEHSSRPLGYDTNSILAVPVIFADELMGVINIEGLSLAQFDESDQEFVTTLADNTASIISNIRLLEQVRDQVDRQRKLFEITNKIRRSLDIETIMQTSISEICTSMNIARATIKISPEVSGEEEMEKKS